MAVRLSYDNYVQLCEPRPPVTIHEGCSNLYNRTAGPTAKALGDAATHSGMFFYFVQPEHCGFIADEMSQYYSDKRVEDQHAK
ncbi:hypothetical protein PHPALM_27825 [Phytophthora palmivora]|uniref:Uncharacterized protein n=1 Tax=Phytophthora palmivora TaxID=4796 RepID=A0A2P4XBN7_9STRA|nr:hypothetical protein PHPALM_27825 [Phytophthora palmivora]